jgi:hypothetical protein
MSFWDVLIRRLYFVRERSLDLVVRPSRKDIYPRNFHSLGADHRRDVYGHSIMVAVHLGGVARVPYIEKALEHAPVIGEKAVVDAIRA